MKTLSLLLCILTMNSNYAFFDKEINYDNDTNKSACEDSISNISTLVENEMNYHVFNLGEAQGHINQLKGKIIQLENDNIPDFAQRSQFDTYLKSLERQKEEKAEALAEGRKTQAKIQLLKKRIYENCFLRERNVGVPGMKGIFTNPLDFF